MPLPGIHRPCCVTLQTQGKRGLDTNDPLTTEMKQQLNALNKDQLQQLARLYSRRNPLPDSATVPGNSARGKPLYDEHCKGCHSGTIGRFMTKSPDIANMKGPYLLSQLKLFAADKRLFSVAGKHKTKMVKVAKQFNDHDLADIVAYIKSEQP
jgi:cytochrome c553